jgi:hypothetical protein
LTKGKLFYILTNKLQLFSDEKDMSATERFIEREDKAGSFLTQRLHLPPWSRIGEVIVISTVAATIQQS